MKMKKKVIAVSGSTRSSSTNLNLIRAIETLYGEHFDMTIYNEIASLPHFNPDLEHPSPPEAVVTFRKKLREADGILICTPEYAMGVPGSLKNAIDWTVSSCEFSHKPTALVTASSVGQKGHAALMETLKVIEANITDDTQLIVPFAKTKISASNVITDDKTLVEITSLLNAFERLMHTEGVEDFDS
jgi:chromate reductase, NAD(P)H dehydrogenase (quinone)